MSSDLEELRTRERQIGVLRSRNAKLTREAHDLRQQLLASQSAYKALKEEVHSLRERGEQLSAKVQEQAGRQRAQTKAAEKGEGAA